MPAAVRAHRAPFLDDATLGVERDDPELKNAVQDAIAKIGS